MYLNDGGKISEKYGYGEKAVIYNWWKSLKALESELKKQKKFKEAKIVDRTIKKAVEPAYNYYRIEPQKISDRAGTVVFSLIFYVIYTLWFGFSILLLFEGGGLKLEH